MKNTNNGNKEKVWFKNCWYKDNRRAKDMTGQILYGQVV